ncbi:MAG: HAD family hydrolase [Polyangiaceae bacterium]|nr:HAD family hydrolase [Polyangiaceae bacterium]
MTALGIIFDCDGVLVDSEPLASRVLAECLCEVGMEISPLDADLRYRGKSLRDVFLEVEATLEQQLPPDFGARLNLQTQSLFDQELKAVEGVEDVLKALQEAKIPLCVASSGSPQKIAHSLELVGLTDYFEGRLFSALQVQHGKPAPDLFLYAASQLGLKPESCAVIEDSLPGILGAKQANTKVFGYAARTPRADIQQLEATAFDTMKELQILLEQWQPQDLQTQNLATSF